MAVRHCAEMGYGSVAVMASERLSEDLTGLPVAAAGESRRRRRDPAAISARASRPRRSTAAFRMLMEGAELVALQHNRYWRRADGLALDVGAYATALAYASGRDAIVVGKPASAFFAAAMAEIGVEHAVMLGDDVESDVGGAMAAGCPACSCARASTAPTS